MRETEAWMERIRNHDAVLVFFGYVDHIDSSGTKRDTGFYRTYEPSSQRFVAEQDPDYEWG
jgi:hypothetical protein